MKRILIFVLFMTSLSLFSQSEIWGVKHFAGSENGGILFSIDSATQKIEIQHRFFRYVLPYRGTSMTQIGNSNEFIGCTGDEIFKYNIESGDYHSVSSFGTLFGDFIDDNQGHCYYRANNNGDTYSYKLDVFTMKYERANFNLSFDNAIINPTDENEFLVWKKIYGSKEQLTAVNFNTGESRMIYEQEIPIHSRIGRIIAENNKIYSLASLEFNGKMSLFIDSYDLDTDTYKEEIFYTNDSLEYHYELNWLKGFVMDTDGKLYGAGTLIPNDDQFYMFSFDTSNSNFEILAPITDDIGNNLVGNLVIDEEQNIFGNCDEGGAHDLGSVFSYNPLNDQIDLVYSHLPNSDFETKSGLALAPNGDIIGMSSSLDTNIHRHIYQVDRHTYDYQNLKTIDVNPSVYKGFYPTDFTQLNDGKIIGITSHGGDSYNPYQGAGTLYQFSPEQKEYKKLMNIRDVFPNASFATQVFTTSENKVLGFYHAESLEKSFLYNPEATEVEYVSEEPINPYLYNNKWIRESENSLIRANNPNQKFERYHILTHEIEELFSFVNYGAIDHLMMYDEDHLLFQLHKNDSSFLAHFNLSSLDLTIITDLNAYAGDYSAYDDRSINFSFIKTAEDLLVGEFIEKLNYSKWDITYRKTVSFDLSTLEMRTLNSGNTKSPKPQYSFISDYYNNGDAFAVNVCQHYGEDAGFLRQVDVIMDSIYNIDEFEMPSWIYELDAEEEEFGFRILKKLKANKIPDIINELEEGHIKAFYSNKTLNIQSKNHITQAEFSIFDMAGRQVFTFTKVNFIKTEHHLNLEAGTYILQTKLDRVFHSEKFIVPE